MEPLSTGESRESFAVTNSRWFFFSLGRNINFSNLLQRISLFFSLSRTSAITFILSRMQKSVVVKFRKNNFLHHPNPFMNFNQALEVLHFSLFTRVKRTELREFFCDLEWGVKNNFFIFLITFEQLKQQQASCQLQSEAQ